MRLVLLACLTAAIGTPVLAQNAGDTIYRVQGSTFACGTVRAARALHNPAEPRLSDPAWVAFVASDGHCEKIDSASAWQMSGIDGDMALMSEQGAQPPRSMFIPRSLLIVQVPEAAKAAPPAPASIESPASPEPAATPADPMDAYTAGKADRVAWESWFGGLTGDARAGAEYWAGHRSLPHPGSCSDPSKSGDWLDGCGTAQARLTPIDARRRTEPDYRRGWNEHTEPPAQAAQETATPPAGQPATPAPSSDRGGQEVPDADGQTIRIAPSVPPVPATTAAPSEQDGGGHGPGGGTAFVLLVLAGFGVWGVFSYRRRISERRRIEQRRRDFEQWLDDAMAVASAEIERQADKLRIRKTQTVETDFYGTPNFAKWQQEKERFTATRIHPLLAARGMLDAYPRIADAVDAGIEEAASQPGPVLQPRAPISNPEVFSPSMDPIDYERHCALLLEQAGWMTRLTVTSGDQGADVIAEREGRTLVVQCKLYSKPVGNDAVQQAHAARTFQGADLAAVVSNATFTRSARQLAQVNGVHLLHHEQLLTFEGDE